MTPSARRHRISVVLSISSTVLAGLLSMSLRPAPALATANLRVDLSPELTAAAVGARVTLTVTAQNDTGAPATGASARVYFVSGPDDPGGHGNNPDFTCTTGADGTCAVSYTPVATGTDIVCAVVTGAPWQCDEPVDAPEFDDNADVVQVDVSLDGVAPDPTAAPTVAPDPTAAPTVAPDPTAGPISAPAGGPTSTPAAQATNAPGATVTPTADPGASADAVPSPAQILPLTAAVEPGRTTPSGPSAGTSGTSGTSNDSQAKGDGRGLLETVLSGLANRLSDTVRPEAVEAIARTFGFPLALAILVIIFLLVQERLDSRDPKLRHAPRSAGETYIAFEDEA